MVNDNWIIKIQYAIHALTPAIALPPPPPPTPEPLPPPTPPPALTTSQEATTIPMNAVTTDLTDQLKSDLVSDQANIISHEAVSVGRFRKSTHGISLSLESPGPHFTNRSYLFSFFCVITQVSSFPS